MSQSVISHIIDHTIAVSYITMYSTFITHHMLTSHITGPGMYRNALNQWVVDDSIRLEAGADADDAIEL